MNSINPNPKPTHCSYVNAEPARTITFSTRVEYMQFVLCTEDSNLYTSSSIPSLISSQPEYQVYIKFKVKMSQK